MFYQITKTKIYIPNDFYLSRLKRTLSKYSSFFTFIATPFFEFKENSKLSFNKSWSLLQRKKTDRHLLRQKVHKKISLMKTNTGAFVVLKTKRELKCQFSGITEIL